jgi:zinc transport system ATP-binding protein
MNETPIINLAHVGFQYENRSILHDVSLAVAPKEFVSIIGPNGGGKTTLLKLILGLLTPSQGEIHLFGQSPTHTRHRVGYVPQYIFFDPQFPITVREVVAMGRLRRRWLGGLSQADRTATEAAMDEMHILPLAQHLFSQLSGGQRQRVLIARALAGAPEVMLLDEPTANVDSEGENKLSEILRELNQRMTILLVSHDLSFVANMVQRVVCVNRHVVLHTPTDLSTEAIQNLYNSGLRMVRHSHECFDEEHPHV